MEPAAPPTLELVAVCLYPLFVYCLRSVCSDPSCLLVLRNTPPWMGEGCETPTEGLVCGGHNVPPFKWHMLLKASSGTLTKGASVKH